MKFIRVLYGTPKKGKNQNKIQRDLKRCFSPHRSPEHVLRFVRDEIAYYTLGPWATKVLQDCGATNVIQVSKKPLLRISGGVYSWNKLFLVQTALKEHGEVVYTDIDTYPRSTFDFDRATELLRNRRGLARHFQMPLISYHKGYFWFRRRSGSGWQLISPAIGLFGCFIYAASLRLVAQFFEDYEELTANGKKAGDEQFITYSLDKRYGPFTLRGLYEHFQPDTRVMGFRCPFLAREGVLKVQEAMFKHRR